DLLSKLADQHGVREMIELLPPVGYGPALAEMLLADGLLVLQASNCNQQVPAKIYEYLRARRPIVCLSDAAGDTCRVLQRAGVSRIAPLDRSPEIAALLQAFADGDRFGFLAPAEGVAAASRRSRAAELAELLNNSLAEARAPRAGLQTAAGATP
ncbi:MAG TPA: hypothetical protein VEZ89_01185, partial [Rubrivivax sp.]|nr:hypothetical protein [Rubrivivax sp.]